MMGLAAGWGESGDGTKNGLTTNMHITSSLVDGPVPKELCIIPTLREHDFGGQLNRGHLTGADADRAGRIGGRRRDLAVMVMHVSRLEQTSCVGCQAGTQRCVCISYHNVCSDREACKA